MVAPTVVTSTIQLMAVRPSRGSTAEIASTNTMAFRGTPCSSSLPIHLGIISSSVIA